MKPFLNIILILLLLPATKTFAQGPSINYDFGPVESHYQWGVLLPNLLENSDLQLRLGTRLQGSVESKTTRLAGGKPSSDKQDFYVRRARLQVAAKMKHNFSFYMDLRADNVDRGVRDPETFALGDAFFQVSSLFGIEALKLRLFRSKFDVSRSQTVSSSRVLVLNRSSISDYSAEFISKARRGSNIQILGNWSNRLKFQAVVGDSVHENTFMDSLSQKSATLNSQNLAYGVRVRVSPFHGWEEKALTETTFGWGQHFSLGIGSYFVNNINFTSSSQTLEVDRQLTNVDLSFHYGSFSLTGEFFIFQGMVEDFSAAQLQTGSSDGWFGQMEYVFTQFHYIAPFLRIQDWDRFKANSEFSQNSWLVGLNYYLKGNKLRIGSYVENTDFARGLTATGVFPDSETLINMNFMMHY